MIYLNVGGVLYATSHETLSLQDNFFRALVRSENNTEEPIFIDRDPSLFRYILNWLRGVPVLPDDISCLKELLYESEFYCMTDLREEVEKKILKFERKRVY
jgi:hypothetical protein